MIERISIELTNRCGKGCAFCYNRSAPTGETRWSPASVAAFVRDCAANGVKAVSFGGGEPLEFDGVFDVLRELNGVLFRSMTTNGLPLRDPAVFDALIAARPDKVHVSIHFPDRAAEVERVIELVRHLQESGVRSGVNFLIARSQLAAAIAAAARVRGSGVTPERIVYLPMRGHDTPSPREVSMVAGGAKFQSMSCLAGCANSERFCSIGWDRRVAWCSYTSERRRLDSLDYDGLMAAMDNLSLVYCGGENDG